MYDLIIFDVDGTLVKPKSGAVFRKTADDWELIEGRAEVLRQLQAAGKKIVLASNQGGIGMGYFREADMQDALWDLLELLNGDEVYYCPDHPDALIEEYRSASFDRKPAPGMLLRAMLSEKASAPRTLMVGDRTEDAQAAENAGVKFMSAEQFFIFGGWREALRA